MAAVNLTDEEFVLISLLVNKNFGIYLNEQKRTLIVERLQKIIVQGGFESFKDYYYHVIADKSGQSLLQLADQISTNYTYFYREKEHYDFLLQNILPQVTEVAKKTGKKEIKIWSAGCSTGEEPYTTAIVLREYFGTEIKNWDIGILATDISVSALEKAKEGIYPAAQLAHLPPHYRLRYFTPAGNDRWSVVPELSQMVLFRRLNLKNDIFPFKNQFNVIFCRNVMIYFGLEDRKKLVDLFYRFTVQNGYLFISHSESLHTVNKSFSFIQPAVYHKI